MKKEKKKKILSEVLSRVKMSNVGKDIRGEEEAMSSSYQEQDIIYPNLYLDSKQLSRLEEYDAGDEIILIVKGEIKGVSKYETNEDEEKASYDIEIKKIGCPGPKIEDDDEY